MLIEVAETHPGAPGKAATVVTASGDQLEAWPEVYGSIRVGGRYEVEVKDRDFKGKTYRKIVKVTPVNGAAPVNGTARPVPHESSGQIARGLDGEGEVVGRALAALILKGEVRYQQREIEAATRMLRDAWRATSSN